MATVVMLVILRLGLGCHFLYEGVWKIENADKFSAAPFLSEAKGPAAKFFYAMLGDLDGRGRLGIEVDGKTLDLAVEKDDRGVVVINVEKDSKSGKVVRTGPAYKLDSYLPAWKTYKEKFAARYALSDEQGAKADELYLRYADSAQQFVDDKAKDILTYYKSRQRFEAETAQNNGAAHQRERTWKRERELRKEVGAWIGELDAMGRDYQKALWNLLDEDQQSKGPIRKSWNPLSWARTDQINFAVTWALTAIGFCLIAGFFTRLAALGGGMFMLFVVLTQPAWPTIFPHDLPQLGHAMLINKDFIEMLALFTIATTAVGRWGGLDYFVHHLLVCPFCCKTRIETKEGERR